LHVTPAAVSHQIRGLEEYLGITLFRRTTRSLVLTEQASAAAETLREAFERIGEGVDRLRSSRRGGTLVIGVTPAFATRWLVGRLPRLQRLHPRLQLHVKASPSPVDFDEDDVDVAIRIGRGSVEGVAAVALFGEFVAPVASPSLLERRRLRRPVDLAKMPLLHDGSMRRAGRKHGWREWFLAAGVANADATRGTHFDDGHLTLQAATAGTGVALGRLVYAADDLAARRLRIVLPPVIRLDFSYNLLVPERSVNAPAVIAFREWVEAEAVAFRRSFAKLLGSRTAQAT
jgi:LysR family glycine cleavage system transcriptional activator